MYFYGYRQYQPHALSINSVNSKVIPFFVSVFPNLNTLIRIAIDEIKLFTQTENHFPLLIKVLNIKKITDLIYSFPVPI